MNEIKNHWKKWLYWFLLGVAIIIVYKTLDNFGDITNSIGTFFSIISPFLVGIFIAYLLYVPCKKVENALKKVKLKIISKSARGLSILFVYLIALLLIVILINVILPVVFESVSDFINNIQGYYDTAINNFNNLPEDSVFKSQFVKEMIDEVKNINIKQYITPDKIFEYLINALSAVTGIFEIFVALVVSIYILADRAKLLNFLKRFASAIFKQETYKNIDKYFNNSNEIFFKFIASQFLDAIVVGVLVTIAMSLMEIKYAPLLGFFIGLFNMIPYVGAIIATVISALITLITGGLSQTIWMLIVTIILQQIDANIINPKIVGQSLKISPLLVLFAVTVGGAYFGILGMFLAVPVIAVIRILVEDYIVYKNYLKKRKEKENVEISKIGE